MGKGQHCPVPGSPAPPSSGTGHTPLAMFLKLARVSWHLGSKSPQENCRGSKTPALRDHSAPPLHHTTSPFKQRLALLRHVHGGGVATSRCTGLNLGPAGQVEGRVWVHALPIMEPRGDLLSPDTQPRRLPSHGVPCPPWENPEAWKTGLHTGSGSGGRTFLRGSQWVGESRCS